MADITLGEILHRKSGGNITNENPLAVKQTGGIVTHVEENSGIIPADGGTYSYVAENIAGNTIGFAFRENNDKSNYRVRIRPGNSLGIDFSPFDVYEDGEVNQDFIDQNILRSYDIRTGLGIFQCNVTVPSGVCMIEIRNNDPSNDMEIDSLSFVSFVG